MGSNIEINDTLQLTFEQGFPCELSIKKHQEGDLSGATLALNKVYTFRKEDIRIFHPAPTRVFLVQNLEGKWISWGHAVVIEQTINAVDKTTSGKFRILKIYDPSYQIEATKSETPEGRSFF